MPAEQAQGHLGEPREVLRAIPGLTFTDVDRVTQWSYCSGRRTADREARAHGPDQRPALGPGGRPRRRHARQRLPLVRAAAERRATPATSTSSTCTSCWRSRSASRSAARGAPDDAHGVPRPRRPLLVTRSLALARSHRRQVAPVTITGERLDELHAALYGVLRPDQVLTSKTDRFNRARVGAVPGPPVGRARRPTSSRCPRAPRTSPPSSASPTSYESRSCRDGGTGLTDGAVPLHHGILVDVKRMNQIHELDLDNRTCTVGTGINMLKLNEVLGAHGLIYPDNPASYPCSLVGGRIGTSGWSLIGSRYGTAATSCSASITCSPPARSCTSATASATRSRRAPAATSSSTCSWATRGRSASRRATLKLFPKPEAELSPFFAFADYDSAYRCCGALARGRRGDVRRGRVVRRVEGRLPAARRRGIHPPARRREGTRLHRALRVGGRSPRRRPSVDADRSRPRWPVPRRRDLRGHATTATPRRCTVAQKAGQVVPMSWHCEDASINYTNLPAVTREWHAIVAELRRKTDVFDDWGCSPTRTPRPASTTHGDRCRDLGAAARRRGVEPVRAGCGTSPPSP